MSIALLKQVFDEIRRVNIAGSGLASGDFRLKKLIPPLEKAGSKAPVFTQVAKAVDRLVAGPENDSAQALLDLNSLLVAILYTQGETNVEGDLTEIEPVLVSLNSTQTSARMLKPLIEALTTKGSGRLQVIQDGFDRGDFNDLRLVNHAVAGLDDKYKDIGDFLADKVLPAYGVAIVPLIKDRIDVKKGTGGSVRRLRLLYHLAPQIARPIVLNAFENGSKEMRIAALACLGDSPDDLPHLLQQSASKNKEVRKVAFERLGNFSDADVIDVFAKALTSADLNIATAPISQTKSPKLVELAIEETRKSVAKLPDKKTEKAAKTALARIKKLLDCFFGRNEKSVMGLLGDLFKTRGQWLPAGKGMSDHAEEVTDSLAWVMTTTNEASLLKLLAEAHTSLVNESFHCSLAAARMVWTPAAVYKTFSPYYQFKTKQKNHNSPEAVRKYIVSHQLGNHSHYLNTRDYYQHRNKLESRLRKTSWSSKWVDAAIDNDDFQAVQKLAVKKTKALADFLDRRFEKEIKNNHGHQLGQIIDVAIRINHGRATAMVVEALQKYGKLRHKYYFGYWMSPLIERLPAKSSAAIEKIVPQLPPELVDEISVALRKLKMKSK